MIELEEEPEIEIDTSYFSNKVIKDDLVYREEDKALQLVLSDLEENPYIIRYLDGWSEIDSDKVFEEMILGSENESEENQNGSENVPSE